MTGRAYAKVNLALVVGPRRRDGKHELLTVFQRVGLADRITVRPAAETAVGGYPEDTVVRSTLALLDAPHGWHVHIDKTIPVAAGLGGGSSDAATALLLANRQLDRPLLAGTLHELAATAGADVPFFLRDGPQLGSGNGTVLEPLQLPQDFAVALLLPHGVAKDSTAGVYDEFDRRGGGRGFDGRAAVLREALAQVTGAGDLDDLPSNDLASSPLADELRACGAFRADVSGAGPVVYGLFHDRADADRAAHSLRGRGRMWVTTPVWSG